MNIKALPASRKFKLFASTAYLLLAAVLLILLFMNKLPLDVSSSTVQSTALILLFAGYYLWKAVD